MALIVAICAAVSDPLAGGTSSVRGGPRLVKYFTVSAGVTPVDERTRLRRLPVVELNTGRPDDMSGAVTIVSTEVAVCSIVTWYGTRSTAPTPAKEVNVSLGLPLAKPAKVMAGAVGMVSYGLSILRMSRDSQSAAFCSSTWRT